MKRPSIKKPCLREKTRKSILLAFTAAIFILSIPSLFAKDEVEQSVKDNLKKTKEEARSLGKENNKEAKAILESLFSSGKLATYCDDFLPEEDRGKTFDETLAAEKTDKQEFSPFEATLQEVIDSSLRTEELEGTEDFLISSRSIMESAKKGIGITSEQEAFVPEEKNIETCEEGGSFIKTIDKERAVTVIPLKTEEIRTCLGHKKEKEFFWESDAKKQVEEWNKEFFEDFSLKAWNVTTNSGGVFSNYHVVKKWTHKDGLTCDKNHIETKVLQEEKEIDYWEIDPTQKKTLQVLEASVHCLLLQIQEFNPGKRNIMGKDIYRDSWNQRLIFSCQPEADSQCKRLREKGGVLLKRACLQEDDFGDCLSWEKTYDLGGKTSYFSQKITFEEEDLFNLEDFDPSYEKNTEFGQVVSTFGALESLGESISERGFDPNSPSIFCGSSSKCRRSFDSKNLFDCCHKKDCKGRGVFIGLDLGRCNKEEKDLFEKVQEGKCHRIGHIRKLLITEHVYCCFPTKLARIIQEEGHKQLGISWGKPEEPNCQGLTLAQLQSLDFEQMDFTDFIEEVQEKIDSQKLAAKLKSMAEGFSSSLSEDQLKAKTGEKTEISKEKIKQLGEG
ncbi:MAG: conjugal transfer protein TraN [Chlamydiia bacterium]|nr:conjugal transfer protein TraN [Chlamydiia bacterium]